MGLFKKGDARPGVMAVVAGLIFLAAGSYYFFHHMTYVTTDDAYVEGRIRMVAPKIPGTIQAVYVEDNQPVRKGDPLVDIDPADYLVKVKEAEAALLAQKATSAEAEAGIRVAQAGLDIQKTAFAQARLDAVRAGKLFSAGALTKEKLEKAQTALSLAEAQVKAAKEQVGRAEAAKELAFSLVGQREAVLENAKLNLGYTKVVSPADGFVTKKAIETGSQVQAGQPLMAVVALEDVWVVANYKETQLKKVHPGQPVEFRVDTYPDVPVTGKVESIMAGTGAAFSIFPAENALGNYVKVVQRIPVKITIDRNSLQGRQLRVGMSVVAKVRIK